MLGWMEIKVRSRNVEMVMLSQVVQGPRELPWVDNKIKTGSSILETCQELGKFYYQRFEKI